MKKRLLLIVSLIIAAIIAGGCQAPKEDKGTQENKEGKNETNLVYFVQTTPPNMLEQLNAGEIDGFIAWEPFNSVAVDSGRGKYLFKSRDIWKDHPCCVLAVNRDYRDPVTVAAVTWAHVKAIRFINDPQNREKVIRYAAEFTGKSPEVVTKALENIIYVEYPAKDRFKEYFNSLEQGRLLKKKVTDIGFADSDSFFDGFLQNSVYQKVAANLDKNPDWVPGAVPAKVRLRVGYLNHDLHQLALYVAEKEGFYQKVGLTPGKNLETKFYQNGVAVMEAFKAKDIDMAYLGGAPAILKRINDNIPIEVVAGANDEGSGLVVRSDLGIDSVDDLRGKTIAVPGVGTVQYTLLDKALKAKGLRLVVK